MMNKKFDNRITFQELLDGWRDYSDDVHSDLRGQRELLTQQDFPIIDRTGLTTGERDLFAYAAKAALVDLISSDLETINTRKQFCEHGVFVAELKSAFEAYNDAYLELILDHNDLVTGGLAIEAAESAAEIEVFRRIIIELNNLNLDM